MFGPISKKGYFFVWENKMVKFIVTLLLIFVVVACSKYQELIVLEIKTLAIERLNNPEDPKFLDEEVSRLLLEDDKHRADLDNCLMLIALENNVVKSMLGLANLGEKVKSSIDELIDTEVENIRSQIREDRLSLYLVTFKMTTRDAEPTSFSGCVQMKGEVLKGYLE